MSFTARFEDQLTFDRNLHQGQTVCVRWTNSHRYLEAKATVTKVNAKTVLVRLEHPVAGEFHDGWPVGHIIKVARFMCPGQSINNGVFPAQEFVVFDKRGIYSQRPRVTAFSQFEAKELALPMLLGCPVEQVLPQVVAALREDLRMILPHENVVDSNPAREALTRAVNRAIEEGAPVFVNEPG